MLLEAKDLNVYYGAIHALQGVSFSVDEGEIVSLIGANGAGKSTTLKTISGLLRPRVGDVLLRGESLKTMPAQDIVRRGVIHVPEGRKIFAPLTVQENLEMGAFTRKDKDEIRTNLERVFKSFPRLKERLNQLGGTLSGGEQQMLAIGRGLMAQPQVLLLDEPSMGLAPILVEEIFSIIKEINCAGRGDPPGGAERVDGAVRRQSRLRAGDRPDRARRDRTGVVAEPAGDEGVSGRALGNPSLTLNAT